MTYITEAVQAVQKVRKEEITEANLKDIHTKAAGFLKKNSKNILKYADLSSKGLKAYNTLIKNLEKNDIKGATKIINSLDDGGEVANAFDDFVTKLDRKYFSGKGVKIAHSQDEGFFGNKEDPLKDEHAKLAAAIDKKGLKTLGIVDYRKAKDIAVKIKVGKIKEAGKMIGAASDEIKTFIDFAIAATNGKNYYKQKGSLNWKA